MAAKTAALFVGDSVALVAYGHTTSGDSSVVAATWASSIGTIAAGWLHADQSGAGSLHAVSAADPSQTDSTAVAVASVTLVPSDTLVSAGGSVQVISEALLPDGSLLSPSMTWSVTGGTISPTGLYSAPDGPGTYEVFAQVTGHAASASRRMRVIPVALRALVLNPTTVSMLTGGTRQFSVAALWSNGSAAVPALNWSASGGTLTASGLYTAPATGGAYQVVVAADGFVDTSVVLVTPPAPTVVQVSLNPKTVALVTSGTNQYSTTVGWSDGSSSSSGVVYSATGGAISASGLYTAGTIAGSYHVIATHQASAKADTGTVTISPPAITLVALLLNPTSVTLASGATQQFSVAGQWSDGSSAVPAVTYSATGGMVTPSGGYTAGAAAGSFRVIATQNGGTRADTATLTIPVPAATLTLLVLNPKSLTLQYGATQQFSVAGSWSDGSSTTPAVSYSATGGTVSSSGLYTAGTAAGVFRVVAAQVGGSKVDTSTVTVVAPPTTLTKLTFAPKTTTLAIAGTQQFTVSGNWSDGSTTAPTATYSATGGTITAGGLYTAGAIPGAFRVIATQTGGTKADTATVTIPVPAPTLTTLVLNPSSTTLQFGGTQQLSVTGSWSDGSATVPTVTYVVTGGTITAGGLYTAGTAAGSFRVIATQQGGTKADTVTATVTAPAPPPQTATSWLHTDGRLIRDATGKLIVLRGVNMYIRLQNEPAKFAAAKAMGANVVRLMLWKQDIEGNPGTLYPGQDQRGLAAIDDAVRWAHDAGLMVILEQQTWAYQVAPAPVAFFSDTTLQASWLSMWRTVIDRYRNDETVIGVDLMNEPWDIQPRPVGAQAAWEAIAERAVATLRPHNSSLLFVVEGWGMQTQPMWNDVSFLQQPNTIISDHVYGQQVFQFLSDRYSIYTNQNVPVWLGEIGFLPTDQSFMASQLDNFDKLGLHYTIFTFGASSYSTPYDIVTPSYSLTAIGQAYSSHITSLPNR